MKRTARTWEFSTSSSSLQFGTLAYLLILCVIPFIVASPQMIISQPLNFIIFYSFIAIVWYLSFLQKSKAIELEIDQSHRILTFRIKWSWLPVRKFKSLFSEIKKFNVFNQYVHETKYSNGWPRNPKYLPLIEHDLLTLEKTDGKNRYFTQSANFENLSMIAREMNQFLFENGIINQTDLFVSDFPLPAPNKEKIKANDQKTSLILGYFAIAMLLVGIPVLLLLIAIFT